MANLGINFDATSVEPIQEMGAFPPDWYNVMITGSEIKQTSKKDGRFIAMEYTVIDGAFAKRKVFENINFENKNASAQEIAQRTLSAICHATGVFQINDTQSLHGIPFQLKVGVEPEGTGTDGKVHPARNNAIGYKSIDGTVPTAGAPASAAATPAWATQAAPQVQQAAPAQFAPPVAPTPPQVAAPAVPQVSPTQLAVQDGWQPHPSAPGYYWKGQEVLTEADMATRYSVATAPVAPPAPPAPPVIANAAPSANPPWAAVGAAPPAGASLPQPTAQTTAAPPPWQK